MFSLDVKDMEDQLILHIQSELMGLCLGESQLKCIILFLVADFRQRINLDRKSTQKELEANEDTRSKIRRE